MRSFRGHAVALQAILDAGLLDAGAACRGLAQLGARGVEGKVMSVRQPGRRRLEIQQLRTEWSIRRCARVEYRIGTARLPDAAVAEARGSEGPYSRDACSSSVGQGSAARKSFNADDSTWNCVRPAERENRRAVDTEPIGECEARKGGSIIVLAAATGSAELPRVTRSLAGRE